MKIISGGQTGADQGGLEAGKELGFETGGWMPKGFLTEAGPRPEFAELYGIVEHSSTKYPPRTFMNAKMSDATLRIAFSFSSAGEKCTLKAIHQYDKPYRDVQIDFSDNYNDISFSQTPEEIAQWLEEENIRVLNVAGNRESTCPGLQQIVKQFLIRVFQ